MNARSIKPNRCYTQFTPDQGKAASEILRVCRPCGKIGLASTVPEGWSGDFFAAHAKYVPPPPDVNPPSRWGTDKGLGELLGQKSGSIKNEKPCNIIFLQIMPWRFSNWFGPTLRAMERIDENQRENLLNDFKDVFSHYNRSPDGTAILKIHTFKVLCIFISIVKL